MTKIKIKSQKGRFDLEKLIEKLEKLKNSFKKNEDKKLLLNNICEAKKELEIARRSFNETIMSDYVDIAILNLSLAEKKYDVCLKEARDSIVIKE